MPIHLWPAEVQLTRRNAIAGISLGSVALALGEASAIDDGDEKRGWFALVSDTHIAAFSKARTFGHNMADNLRAVIADILSSAKKPAGVLINGDLARKNGRPEDYALFLQLLAPLRKANIPLHFTLGNHDDRGTFREAASSVADVVSGLDDKQVGSFVALGHRFIMLDSLDKVDTTPGMVGPEQLAWLAKELDAPAALPTLVFVHHNLRTKGVPGLVDGDALFDVVKVRPCVKAVLNGHTHHWNHVREAEVDLINLPAVAYPFNQGEPLGYCRMRVASGQVKFQLRQVVGNRKRHRETLAAAWTV